MVWFGGFGDGDGEVWGWVAGMGRRFGLVAGLIWCGKA